MTLLSALILLAGALVRPRIHYRNGYICWSRCSVEALVNCKFQALIVDRKGEQSRGLYELEGGNGGVGGGDLVGGFRLIGDPQCAW